jgi:hypothetical protein
MPVLDKPVLDKPVLNKSFLYDVLRGKVCHGCGLNPVYVPSKEGKSFLTLFLGRWCKCGRIGRLLVMDCALMCHPCAQRMKKTKSPLSCTVCSDEITGVEKLHFVFDDPNKDTTLRDALYAIVAQAMFESSFPKGYGRFNPSSTLTEFYPFFDLYGRQKAHSNFLQGLLLILSQTSGAKLYALPEEGVYTPKTKRKILCFSMIRKLFLKLFRSPLAASELYKINVFSSSYMTEPSVKFLKRIIARILSRFIRVS